MYVPNMIKSASTHSNVALLCLVKLLPIPASLCSPFPSLPVSTQPSEVKLLTAYMAAVGQKTANN